MDSTQLFSRPTLTSGDEKVLADILRMREELSEHLRTPKRWLGGLRRHVLAQAIRGSNSIEGYHVEADDAAAALDDLEPLSADSATFAEVRGYRQALTFALTAAADPGTDLEVSTLNSMHFMMLGHDLDKWPGRYRPGPIYVQDERTGTTVYEGPAAIHVPALMAGLVEDLSGPATSDFVAAAMAHLNLDMIHPYRDGNGRMARAAQTLVLARSGVADPTFASI
jgi:Fic family protein